MPIFKSEEEKSKKKAEKEKRQAERQAEAAKKIAELDAKLEANKLKRLKIDEETKLKKAETEATYQREMAEIATKFEPIEKARAERIAKVDAHNRAVINEWKEEVRRIKRDFLYNQRQITQNNRARARGTSVDSPAPSIEETTDLTSDQSSKFAALKELKELLDSGILTQEEFESEKIKLLDSE